MGPETQNHDQVPHEVDSSAGTLSSAPRPARENYEKHDLYWAIVGPGGIRSGWLVLGFYCLFRLLVYLLSGFAYVADPELAISEISPFTALLSELVPFFAMLGAGAIMLLAAHHRPADYNLRDSRGVRHFLSGLVIGFLAISVLVGVLYSEGLLEFSRQTLTTSRIFVYGAVWGLAFLVVGCVEEGTFRCYGQATLTCGINFWWALALVSGFCLYAFFFRSGECRLGVYLFAALGLIPCFLLHLSRDKGSGFWQAAWATSTGFGFVHTLNSGENWIGIFAAAFIGFVFCVSIRVTGSAWWAIGCHAAWDWAETYFYGTADSGFVAPGHLLSTSPAGNPLWSGGTDGPEGSLLIIPIVLLILAWLLVVYRRPRRTGISAPTATEQLAS